MRLGSLLVKHGLAIFSLAPIGSADTLPPMHKLNTQFRSADAPSGRAFPVLDLERHV